MATLIHNLLFLICALCSHSIDPETEQYPWTKRQRYYFPSVEDKMKEVLSPICLKVLTILPDHTILLPSTNATLNVASFPVNKEIVEWWKRISKPSQMRVDPNLCDAVLTKRIPIFNNTGCQLPGYMHPSAPRCQTKYLKYICDQSRIPIDIPISNSFVIPESDHNTAELPPQPWLLTARNSFVSMCGSISTACGLIHTTSNCMGTSSKFQGMKFQKKCPSSLMDNVDISSFPAVSGVCLKGAPYSDEYNYHDRVFVVAEHDDTYVYHLHLEIFPRIVYHLDFLLKNPDIKILIGCDSKKKKEHTDSGLKHMLQSIKPLMELAGLSMDRLIVHRHVFARELHLPMEGGCQDPVYNTWQILTMRHRFMSALNITEPIRDGISAAQKAPKVLELPITTSTRSFFGTNHLAGGKKKRKKKNGVLTGGKSDKSDKSSGSGSGMEVSGSSMAATRRMGETAPFSSSFSFNSSSSLPPIDDLRPVMLLMKRSTGAKHTRNSEDLVRQWSDNFTDRLLLGLRTKFPEYNLKLFSDKDEKLMTCHACQIRAFAEADVLIGMHGAGLSNQLYMKPNSAVVELCPYPNDGRCLLGGGPFSRTAALLSHNYMIHHPPHAEYKWILKDRSSEFDIERFVTHIHSYLQSVRQKRTAV